MSSTTKIHNEHPDRTPDRNVEAGVADTFPASDPVAATVSQGSRAVPVAEMTAGADAKPRLEGGVALVAHFADAEAAKLALETVVRDGPADRRYATTDGGTLHIEVPQADSSRIRDLLSKHGGKLG